jgi:hypothetical protein
MWWSFTFKEFPLPSWERVRERGKASYRKIIQELSCDSTIGHLFKV